MMSHRLKILHIISSWESGVANELAAFAARLPRDEFESKICVLAGQDCRRVPDVPTTTLNRRWSFDVNAHFGMRRTLRQFRPDVIHAWDTTAQCYSTMQRRGSECVLVEKRDTGAPNGWWQNYFDRKTDRFIVPRENDHLPVAKTIIVPPLAVPLSCDSIPAEALLAKLDFPLVEPSGDYYPILQPQYEPARRNYRPIPHQQPPFLIGIVLPLCSEHRILDALWVFETLNHVHLNFHAFFLGEGKDREQFLRYRDRWKLSSRVHFLGNRPAPERLLPSFDVLLHLSSSAEHSGTILSAMSCGVPVIALETPESQEYVLDGTTGFLIPSEGDFRFYRRTAAKRLLSLLKNVELRRSMQIAAKDRIAQKYNFEETIQRRIQIYHEL